MIPNRNPRCRMASKKAVEPMKRLTLMEIEKGWVDLLEARIAAETDPELSDERGVCSACGGRGESCESCNETGYGKSARELAIEAADVALADHSSKEIDKVDGYIAVIGHLEATIAARKSAAKRNQTAARILETMLEQLKASAVYAISVVPGRKRVDGESGYLLVKANGGVAPLLVTDPDLVPSEYVRLEGWVNEADWKTMIEATRRRLMSPDWRPHMDMKRAPDNAAIRAALGEPCPVCKGEAHDENGTPVCGSCGGSGKNAVPGARLGDRGTHLEIR